MKDVVFLSALKEQQVGGMGLREGRGCHLIKMVAPYPRQLNLGLKEAEWVGVGMSGGLWSRVCVNICRVPEKRMCVSFRVERSLLYFNILPFANIWLP